MPRGVSAGEGPGCREWAPVRNLRRVSLAAVAASGEGVSGEQLALGRINFGGPCKPDLSLPMRTDAGPTLADCVAKGESFTGSELADVGIERAAKKAAKIDPAWLETARRMAVLIAERDGEVTSESLVRECPVPDGADPRASGAVFKRLRKSGVLAFAGYAPASNASRHSGPIGRWRLAPPETGKAQGD